MHEMEILDRQLMALQRSEEGFRNINGKIIDNINGRKDRLNALNARI
jgi:hypothetical protein